MTEEDVIAALKGYPKAKVVRVLKDAFFLDKEMACELVAKELPGCKILQGYIYNSPEDQAGYATMFLLNKNDQEIAYVNHAGVSVHI